MMQRRIHYYLSLLVLVLMSAAMTSSTTQAQTTIIGDGTPASCTFAALESAVQTGGTVTFDCGGAVTIAIQQTLDITDIDLTLDGGNQVTLQGVNGVRMIDFRTYLASESMTLTLRNLIIRDASVTGAQEAANGAAVRIRNQTGDPLREPQLTTDNVQFINNRSYQTSTAGNPYDYGGGAIYIRGGTLAILNSTFTNNLSDQGAGGAVHVLTSYIDITGSTFTGNSATPVSSSSNNSGFGGAVYIDGARPPGGLIIGPEIEATVFENNSGANSGGAIYVNMYTGTLTMIDLHFEGNTVSGGANGLGGAVSGGGTGSSVTIYVFDSSFVNNSVADASGGASGGALAFAQPASVTVVGSTFSGNRAEGNCSNCYNANGGAMYLVNHDSLYVLNSTIANNYAGWVGGGITANSGTVVNTIFWNNTADNGGNGWQIQQHCSTELTGDGGNFQYPDKNSNPNYTNEVVCTGDVTIAEPHLDPLSSAPGNLRTMYFPVVSTSPTIDTGNNAASAGINLDAINNPRINNGIIDSGAVEFVSVLIEPDVNGDGRVSPVDVMQVINRLGQSAAGSSADVNDDGIIDTSDVNAVLNSLGQ
jgi:predicted outer membrane repeat protein